MDIDEQSQQKALLAADDPETRLNSLIVSFRLTKEEEERHIQRARLEDDRASDDEKLDVLRELFERKRKRLGTHVPTDG